MDQRAERCAQLAQARADAVRTQIAMLIMDIGNDFDKGDVPLAVTSSHMVAKAIAGGLGAFLNNMKTTREKIPEFAGLIDETHQGLMADMKAMMDWKPA